MELNQKGVQGRRGSTKCTASPGTETDQDESEAKPVETKVTWMDQEKSEANPGPKKASWSKSDKEDKAKWARFQGR